MIHPARSDARNAIRSAISSGSPGAAERVRLLRALEERGVVLLVDAAAAMEVGDDDAGVDGVDADAVRRELERGAARELVDAGLAHAVREHARETRAGR